MSIHPDDRHALVIGAGLSGAATCVALARRGWRLTLLDAAAGPAQAASALPVGMLSPHVTRSPTPLSRLSALGVLDTRAELERLIPQGRGWQACDVDNLGHDSGRWPAALVRPSALVLAWLRESSERTSLTARWNAKVERLQAPSSGDRCSLWQAVAEDGLVLAEAPVVVVAGALGTQALLAGASSLMAPDTLPLRPVQGQMSLAALHGDPLAPRPQRNNGVFVPMYEDAGLPPQWPARIWAMGSTYERGKKGLALSGLAHERNAEHLQAINPVAAARMRETMTRGELMGWAQVRCASLDRLPLMGAVPHLQALRTKTTEAAARRGHPQLGDVPRWPGLYTLSALGSRGLTLSSWCAKQLAAQIDGFCLDGPSADADLIRALDPARFAWRQARRQPIPAFSPA